MSSAKEKKQEAAREWYRDNKELTDARTKAWVENNRERRYELTRNWVALNSDKAKLMKRKSYIKAKYGITLEEYDQMMEDQNYGCAICGESCKINKNLTIDHNHRTGKVRGLLCSKHNRAIGLLEDDPEMLEKALTYLLNGESYD